MVTGSVGVFLVAAGTMFGAPAGAQS